MLATCAFLFGTPNGRAQDTTNQENLPTKHVLLLFGEARDLPGNVLMEQAVRQVMTSNETEHIVFYTESMDAGRFPDTNHYDLFGEYIKNKYMGQKLDLAMMFMARNFMLAREMTNALPANLPSVFVVMNDLDMPKPPGGRRFTGIFQRFDIDGTIKFILRLQPETRHVVVVGGVSKADQSTLKRIGEIAQSIEGVKFDFWTNMPIVEICKAASSLPPDTVILLGTVQRDMTGQAFYTSEVVQMLAPSANVPVYVLGEGLIGTGALGGDVMDSETLGKGAGEIALRVLAGAPADQIPVAIHNDGTPMVDWRALQRWNIKVSRLPPDCVIRYRPRSLWEDHKILIISAGAALLAQAVTIVALLVARGRQRRAEAEIERQRTELTHVTRVSTVGQLASALTHELNQPLGAILRNAEAAELFLQNEPPNLQEVRAILTDIRRDDKRAGNVIDRMRALYKRRSVTMNRLDLREVVEDTIAMTRADAAARQVKLSVQIPPQLPEAQGDRVHLQQVLLNLILNGMDAMSTLPKPRRTLLVRVSETKNSNLRVDVTDQGAGIAPDVAERIFEPFFTTKTNGMGMGLAISQNIIEAHGGDIWVDSHAEKGTTFSFILPPAGDLKVKDGDLPETL
ncbi:MAG TPA: ABC transporter substrate binding protein [Pseudomonadales bacterium]|nr:ABC transporter substrate binding protein [Pseudomonadales bacterium]